MNFTRHGSYVKELNEQVLWDQPITPPVKGIVKGNLTFFDSGSDIIWAGGQLGILSKDGSCTPTMPGVVRSLWGSHA